MKFIDKHRNDWNSANLDQKDAHVRRWDGNLFLWVSPWEIDQSPPCRVCKESTPFFLSTDGKSPINVCSEEHATDAGYPPMEPTSQS
jgi:hypothetical protein